MKEALLLGQPGLGAVASSYPAEAEPQGRQGLGTTRMRADLEAPVTGRSYATPPSSHRARPSPYRLIQARGLGSARDSRGAGAGTSAALPPTPPADGAPHPLYASPRPRDPPASVEAQRSSSLTTVPATAAFTEPCPKRGSAARPPPPPRTPHPGPEASALRVAATPFPARPDGRKQPQPPGPGPSSPLALPSG